MTETTVPTPREDLDLERPVSIPLDKVKQTKSIEDFHADESKSEKYAAAARMLKLVSTIGLILIAILIIAVDWNAYKTIFLYCSIASFFYIATLILIISTARQLHYIRVDRVGIYGYRLFAVPSTVQQKYTNCIKSISDVSAIPGSSTHLFFLVGNSMQYTLILIAISMKLREWSLRQYENVSDTQRVAVYMFLVTDIGMITVALWNLEKHKLSLIMHYFGASCVFFLCSVSFMLYQNFSALSISLVVVQFVTAILYLVMSFKCPHKHDDRKMVHKISFSCILAEVVTCAISMFISDLFLWCMDGDAIL